MPLIPPLIAMLLMIFGSSAMADTTPRPFDARYRLDVEGWPNADVDHRLTRIGETWESRMSAGVPGISGKEMSRFRLAGDEVRSLYYASGYSLLGIQRSYRLGDEALQALPDRQTALFSLSRHAINGDCNAICSLRYLDHKGREKRVDYRLLEPESLDLPAGHFAALRVEVTEPDEPDRRMVFAFLPRLPGLLLAMDYYRDGKRRSRLALTRLETP